MSTKEHVSHTYEFIATQVFRIFREDVRDAILCVYARVFGHVHAFQYQRKCSHFVLLHFKVIVD